MLVFVLLAPICGLRSPLPFKLNAVLATNNLAAASTATAICNGNQNIRGSYWCTVACCFTESSQSSSTHFHHIAEFNDNILAVVPQMGDETRHFGSRILTVRNIKHAQRHCSDLDQELLAHLSLTESRIRKRSTFVPSPMLFVNGKIRNTIWAVSRTAPDNYH
jgi:hypothetical protein